MRDAQPVAIDAPAHDATIALDAPPLSTSGCGHAPSATGIVPHTAMIDGMMRTYDVFVPEGTTGSEPLPLVFVFHERDGGSGGAEAWGMQGAAEAAGDRAIFVFPQALHYQGGSIGWEIACDGYDMQFVDAMLETVSGEQCIDSQRVFATGFSWGADMTIAFGCCRSDVARAVAPSSGTAWGNWRAACPSSAPALRITIGDADGNYSVPDVQSVTDFYAMRNGCAATTTPSDPDPPCRAYDGCAAPVIQCVYPGMGHQIPPDGAHYIWEFFSQF